MDLYSLNLLINYQLACCEANFSILFLAETFQSPNTENCVYDLKVKAFLYYYKV